MKNLLVSNNLAFKETFTIIVIEQLNIEEQLTLSEISNFMQLDLSRVSRTIESVMPMLSYQRYHTLTAGCVMIEIINGILTNSEERKWSITFQNYVS